MSMNVSSSSDRRGQFRPARRAPEFVAALGLALCVVLLAACSGSNSASDNSASDNSGSDKSARDNNASNSAGSNNGGSGERITIGDDEALVWGDGPRGVVLAHGAAFDAASWSSQAEQIADADRTVIAVENIAPEAIVAAVDHLRDHMGIDSVALVGASAGANAILDVDSGDRGVNPEQLILLSPTQTVDGLGTEPKLFIVSEDEPVADVSVELARDAAGDDNKSILIPGSAHAQNIFDTDQSDRVMTAILDRLGS